MTDTDPAAVEAMRDRLEDQSIQVYPWIHRTTFLQASVMLAELASERDALAGDVTRTVEQLKRMQDRLEAAEAEAARLDEERAEQWRRRRDAEASRDVCKEVIADLRARNEALVKAATAVRDDLLMRAERDKHLRGDEIVVAVGAGVWCRLTDTIAANRER